MGHGPQSINGQGEIVRGSSLSLGELFEKAKWRMPPGNAALADGLERESRGAGRLADSILPENQALCHWALNRDRGEDGLKIWFDNRGYLNFTNGPVRVL